MGPYRIAIYCLMLGTIYLLREVIIDEFIGVHVALLYPCIGFGSVAFPLVRSSLWSNAMVLRFFLGLCVLYCRGLPRFHTVLLRRLGLVVVAAVALGLGMAGGIYGVRSDSLNVGCIFQVEGSFRV